MWYPEFISLSCCWVKPYLTPQIFQIYEGDFFSPPEGNAAQEVRPLDPRVKIKCSNNIPAQRGSDEAAERPSKGGLAHIIEYFCEMISGQDNCNVFDVR